MLALFGLRGFFRGLFREVFSLLGLIAGFMIAVAFLPSAASYAAAFWKAPPLFLKGAVFVVIFFLVYFVFSLMGWLLHRSESLLFLKTVNRAGGIAVGLGKGAAIIDGRRPAHACRTAPTAGTRPGHQLRAPAGRQTPASVKPSVTSAAAPWV